MSNCYSLCGPDPVAIRADHLALHNLSLSRSDTLGVANVHGLSITNMVKVKGDRVDVVSTICATMRDLVGIKPISNSLRSFVCKAVHPLPVSRLFQSLFAPLTSLIRLMSALGSGSFSASRRAEHGFSLRMEGNTAGGAGELAGCGVFPRRHKQMLPEMFHPCKPDIFEKTYEVVE